jgi:hypothetical protein
MPGGIDGEDLQRLHHRQHGHVGLDLAGKIECLGERLCR